MEKKRTTFYINVDLYKKLKILAAAKESSCSSVIEELIKKYIEEEN